MKKLFERNDLLIIMAVCVIAIILLLPRFFGGSELTAEITVGGETVKTLNLDEIEGVYEFKTNTSPSVTVTAEKGRICVSDADCPDRLCVKCGWLDADGDAAVCLPAKVAVSVKGEKPKNAPDVITY